MYILEIFQYWKVLGLILRNPQMETKRMRRNDKKPRDVVRTQECVRNVWCLDVFYEGLCHWIYPANISDWNRQLQIIYQLENWLMDWWILLVENDWFDVRKTCVCCSFCHTHLPTDWIDHVCQADYHKYTYQPSIPDKHFNIGHWNYVWTSKMKAA